EDELSLELSSTPAGGGSVQFEYSPLVVVGHVTLQVTAGVSSVAVARAVGSIDVACGAASFRAGAEADENDRGSAFYDVSCAIRGPKGSIRLSGQLLGSTHEIATWSFDSAMRQRYVLTSGRYTFGDGGLRFNLRWNTSTDL